MRRVKLGIIGLGYIGSFHLKNCLRLDSAKLSAVSDLSRRALSRAKRLGIKRTFQNYQELLKDGDLEAVIIALPTHLHVKCITAAAEAGKHILVEKPLARNVTEGEEILCRTRKNGVKLMVGYHLRFCEPFLALKRKKESGVLGEVQSVYATMIGPGPFMHRANGYSPRPVPPWWFQRELTGGGALIDMGSHMINLLRWYLGEVTEVKSYFKYRYNMDSEDQAACFMRFETGASALLNVGWFSQKSQTKIDMYGTFQYDSAEHEAPSKIVTFLQLLTRRVPAFFLPYLSELEHFVHSIRCDSQPSPSCEDGLRDLEAISLAYNNGTAW